MPAPGRSECRARPTKTEAGRYNPMMDEPPRSPRGRAAASNPANRFERIEVELEEPGPEKVETIYLRDTSRSVLSYNESPDVPFDVSLNPYRGCEHGCIYCYARPTHEYLGFSAGLVRTHYFGPLAPPRVIGVRFNMRFGG